MRRLCPLKRVADFSIDSTMNLGAVTGVVKVAKSVKDLT